MTLCAAPYSWILRCGAGNWPGSLGLFFGLFVLPSITQSSPETCERRRNRHPPQRHCDAHVIGSCSRLSSSPTARSALAALRGRGTGDTMATMARRSASPPSSTRPGPVDRVSASEVERLYHCVASTLASHGFHQLDIALEIIGIRNCSVAGLRGT